MKIFLKNISKNLLPPLLYFVVFLFFVLGEEQIAQNRSDFHYSKFGLESSNLPIIVINTFGNTIINESRITAHMGIIYNDNMRAAVLGLRLCDPGLSTRQ